MAKFKVNITMEADSKEQMANIAKGLQNALTKVTAKDLEKMLNLLAKNPQWIKMATNFV